MKKTKNYAVTKDMVMWWLNSCEESSSFQPEIEKIGEFIDNHSAEDFFMLIVMRCFLFEDKSLYLKPSFYFKFGKRRKRILKIYENDLKVVEEKMKSFSNEKKNEFKIVKKEVYNSIFTNYKKK